VIGNDGTGTGFGGSLMISLGFFVKPRRSLICPRIRLRKVILVIGRNDRDGSMGLHWDEEGASGVADVCVSARRSQYPPGHFLRCPHQRRLQLVSFHLQGRSERSITSPMI
jgi:hypothetical protein